MTLPKDPIMLLSVINTALRDHYDSLEQLCSDQQIDQAWLTHSLATIDYLYDKNCNQFV